MKTSITIFLVSPLVLLIIHLHITKLSCLQKNKLGHANIAEQQSNLEKRLSLFSSPFCVDCYDCRRQKQHGSTSYSVPTPNQYFSCLSLNV